MSKWRLITMTGPSSETQMDPRGNIVLATAPGCLMFARCDFRRDTLLIYQSDGGSMCAYLSPQGGKESQDVTNALPDDDWRGMLAQAQAAKALIGKVPEFEKELPL